MKSFETKLYNPRDIGGEPNTEEIKDIRYLENKLSQIPEFVSLSIHGSTVKGYSNETSDVDITILFDSNGIKYNSKEYWQIQERLSKIAQETKSEVWDRKKEKGQRPKNFQFRYVDIGSDVVENEPMSKNRYKKLALLFSLSTGKKIDGYRKYWVDRMNKLPTNEKETWISGIINVLIESTDIDYETLQERTGIADKNNLIDARKKLWRQRIENFLASEK